jgi:hypothetical protein
MVLERTAAGMQKARRRMSVARLCRAVGGRPVTSAYALSSDGSGLPLSVVVDDWDGDEEVGSGGSGFPL